MRAFPIDWYAFGSPISSLSGLERARANKGETMRKLLTAVAVVILLSLVGCGEPEPELETTTLLEDLPEEFVAEPETGVGTDTVATEPAAVDPVTDAAPPPAGPAAESEAEGAPGELPRTHTVDLGGAMHAPGYDNPTRRCATCHGSDLTGGRKAESSCFDCHDQNWD
jgi:hypothetical protein